MTNSIALLQSCPLFDGIEKNDLVSLMSCLNARTMDAPRGYTVLREGEPATHIGIVLEGTVQLIREDYYGNRSIMAQLEPGMLFGEAYAFSGAGIMPVSVIAVESSRILLIDGRRITSCCANACAFHNQVIYNLLRIVANANLLLHQKIHVTSQRTTRDKLMTFLHHQAKQAGTTTFTVPFDRQALADYLEVDRTGLSAEISKLRREGILQCEKSTFRLL